jgi:hypothetical protein
VNSGELPVSQLGSRVTVDSTSTHIHHLSTSYRNDCMDTAVANCARFHELASARRCAQARQARGRSHVRERGQSVLAGLAQVAERCCGIAVRDHTPRVRRASRSLSRRPHQPPGRDRTGLKDRVWAGRSPQARRSTYGPTVASSSAGAASDWVARCALINPRSRSVSTGLVT